MKDILHLRAPENWINDPNGFIYYKGQYHLFYQFFPYNTHWGTMHWGHAVSSDLISWEHLGIALYPTKSYDRNGVFSGSAININDKMYVYYTGARYVDENSDNTQIPVDWKSYQSQAMIVSDDGMTFDNIHGKKQIIPVIENKNIADPIDCRDPKVWRENDTYFMCLGSTHLGEKGVLLIYRSNDAENWEFFSRIESEKLGKILECPDIFSLENRRFLISSPIGINHPVIREMTFDTNSGEITLGKDYRFLDYGKDIYAPQSNIDRDGNRVVISWIRMPEPKVCSDKPYKKWIGMMTLPRIVELRDGVIYTRPHDNIRHYFETNSDSENKLIRATLSEGDSITVDGVKIELKGGCVFTDRSARLPSNNPEALCAVCSTPKIGAACTLEIYDCPDVIEIYINDGRYVITNVKY